MNMSLVYKCQGQCIFPDPLQMSHAIVLGNATKPSRSAHFWQGAQSLPLATQNDIWTSKSAPYPSVFLHRWLGHVLCATTACTFSTCQLPKVVRESCVCTFWLRRLRNVLCATTACTFLTSQLPKVVRRCFFLHFESEVCFAPQLRALFRHGNFQKWSEDGLLCTFWLGRLRNVLRSTTACTFLTSQIPKVFREWCALHTLTSKCASHHYGVHFFRHVNFQTGPTLVCFVHFDLEMCFAPQRCALFWHLNFQKCSESFVLLTSTCASHHNGVHFFDISTSKKWSEVGGLCTFWLGNLLWATTAFHFSLIRPDGSAPAAWVSLLLDLPEPQIIGKNTVNRDFSTFSRTCIFFLLTPSLLWSSLFFSSFFSSPLLFSSLTLPTSPFHLSILSEVWLLSFHRSFRTSWFLHTALRHSSWKLRSWSFDSLSGGKQDWPVLSLPTRSSNIVSIIQRHRSWHVLKHCSVGPVFRRGHFAKTTSARY